jgi:hypothetical protein
MYILNKIKTRIFTSKLLGYIKTFETKPGLKISDFFSLQCTGCAVRWSAEISRRSENIQALLKIGKISVGPPSRRR